MSDESEETSYYLRLLSMYMDLGTEIVLAVFVFHTPGKDAEKFVKSKQGEILQLKKSRVLNGQECELLFEQGKDVVKCRLDIKSFDISLLITLSRNIFTAHELAPPVKGWNNPPRNNDKSVAADLLRLKKIRNVIVGHHPKARLPLQRFENVWDDVSDILIRLQQHMDPGKEVLLQEKIEAYRSQHLDPTVKNKYDAKLKQWHKEVTTMQDKVEELIKKLGGFEAYFNSKSDRFERYTKLLFKGGHFVLSAFLDKKIKDDGRDLHKMLMDNEDDIRKVISDKEQLDKLYPCNPPGPTSQIDTSSWDVSLLSTVILQLYTSTEEKVTIPNIKKIDEAYRNYANATLLALDKNAFIDYWTDLKASINIVSCMLDDSKAECYNQILEECKKKIGEEEFKTYIEELRTQGTQIKSFTETFKDVLKRTRDFLQDMITHGISFKNAQVLELKMITLGTDEQKKKQLAEEILMEVWNEALDRAVQSTNFMDVKKEVLNILEEIKKSKSVENISVRAKCILLQIKCTSPREMLDMIEYFQSSQFHDSIRNISIELGYYFDTTIDVHSVITVECLWRMYSQADETKHDEEGGLSLQMTVSSPEGMKHLISLCSKDTIANCTNSIADALSKHLGGTIALKAVADMKEFKHVFDTDSSSSGSCSNYSSMESNVQDNIYPNQIHAEGRDYMSEGLTLEEITDAEEEPNKHIDGTTYALKSLKLTSDKTSYTIDSEKQTRSLKVETKQKEDNGKRFQEDLEGKTEMKIKDVKRDETDETLLEVDEDLKDIVKDDQVEALKEQQDFKDSLDQGTSPVKRISPRSLSDVPTKTLSINADSEESFETIALLELYQSQIAVAQYLELAYNSLQDSPDIAMEIISTSQLAKDAQKATLTYDVELSTLLVHLTTGLFSFNLYLDQLSRVLQCAEHVRDETEESKERYITLQTYVKKNIQQVEQSICSVKEPGENKHPFKMNIDTSRVLESKDESLSKYDIVRYTPDVTGIHQYKAKKTKEEETILHKLRPGLAFTGGINYRKFMIIDFSFLFYLISENELDLQHHGDLIKNFHMDKQVLSFIDHIVIQRRQEFDRLSTIRKQEKNKGLECLREITRHVENIDTQLTRMMNYWSELTDNIEFLLKNEKMVRDIHVVFLKDNTLIQEWECVERLFCSYQSLNRWSADQSYRFATTAAEKEEYKIQHQLIFKKGTTQGYVSEYKRSDLKSAIGEKVDKRSYLKSPICEKVDKHSDL